MPKTKYCAEILERIKAWVRDGATNVEISRKLGINKDTFYEWIKKHSDLSDALKVTKAVVDDLVVGALCKRAMGFEYEETKIVIDEKGKKKIEKVKKLIPPDPTSMIFWLKNRRRAEWRDRAEHEISGPNGGPIQGETTIRLEGLTDAELETLEKCIVRVDAGNDKA